MRGLRWVTAVAATGVAVMSGGLTTSATLAAAATTSGPVTHYRDISTTAWYGSGQSAVSLPVATGVTPVELTGRVESTLSAGQHVAVLLNGRQVATTTAADAQVQVPVTAADLISASAGDGTTLPVAIEVLDGRRSGTCSQPKDSATLEDLSLSISGTETTPTSLASFFDNTVTNITVAVPPSIKAHGDRTLAQAALQTVASIDYRYLNSAAGSATVRLIVGPPSAPASAVGHRVIELVPGTGEAHTALSTVDGIPTLTISGSPSSLSAAAAALGSQSISLSNTATASSLAGRITHTVDLSPTFVDLGASKIVSLSGYGETSTSVGVHQTQFGGPISDATVHLVGTASAVPTGVQATLTAYWNNYLLGTVRLSSGGPVNARFSVPNGQLQRDNGLTLKFDALSDGSHCGGAAALPVEVDLDGTASTVSADRGQTIAATFQRFPQVLSGTLPIAFGTTMVTPEMLQQASAYVGAMQRASTVPLAIAAPSAASLISGGSQSQSGLLVDATPDQVTALRAPLRMAQFREINPSSSSPFGVGVSGPFASLQVFQSGSRTLLLAADWSPSVSQGPVADAQLAKLARLAASGGDNGWSSLSANLLVATPGNAPVQLDANALVPQAQVIKENSRIPSWTWLAGGAVVLVGVVRFLVVRRRVRRVRRIVDAEQSFA